MEHLTWPDAVAGLGIALSLSWVTVVGMSQSAATRRRQIAAAREHRRTTDLLELIKAGTIPADACAALTAKCFLEEASPKPPGPPDGSPGGRNF